MLCVYVVYPPSSSRRSAVNVAKTAQKRGQRDTGYWRGTGIFHRVSGNQAFVYGFTLCYTLVFSLTREEQRAERKMGLERGNERDRDRDR